MNMFFSNEVFFLKSLCKLSFLTQRVFIFLIHNGFCGQESEDEENKEQEEEDNKYFEDDGCGMGEGKGQ